MLQTISDLIGTVKFITVPEGVDIYVDNIYQDVKTSCTIENVPIGEHIFRLEFDDYVPVLGLLNIQKDITTKVNIEMLPVVEDVGYIIISDILENANVYIDDILDESNISPIIITVSPGNHIIKIFLAGYEDYIEVFSVKVNQMIYINVLMEKLTIEEVEEISVVDKLFKPVLLAAASIGMIKLVNSKESNK